MEHLCTELEVVCMGNERDQKYCYLVQRDKYKQALEEIENYCNDQICLTGDLRFRTTESDILGIISKAKQRMVTNVKTNS